MTMIGRLTGLLIWMLLSAVWLQAQTNFAKLTSDGGWCWFADPRAIFHNGTLYFGCVRSDGRSVLNQFNLQSGTMTNLWVSSLTEFDDHDVCGLQVRPDNTLLALWSRHGGDTFFSYRQSTSTNPVSSAEWGPEQTASTVAGETYCNPHQLSAEGGKIYSFSRCLNYNPTVFTSTDNGNTWFAPTLMIKTGTGSTRPYVKYCSNYTNRIDILYTDAHPDNYTTSLYELYYQSNAFYQTDGSFVTNFSQLPILHDAGQRGSVVYQYSDAASTNWNDWIQSARAWCWDIAYQTNGAPVCVFQTKASTPLGNRIYYYYARWTGTNWQRRFIAQAGRPLYSSQPDYGGGIAIDPMDVNTVYFSSDAANPLDLTTTTNVALAAHYEIYKGVTTDGGLTFAWSAVTTNSTVDNCRPYVPRRFGGEKCVLWWRGTYNSYTSFYTSIVGLFTTAVPTNSVRVTNTLPSYTYVDATSGAGGNTTLADGSVFSPPLNGTTGADNNWEQRTVFGSGGNTRENILGDVLVYNRSKTGTQASIRIGDRLKSILSELPGEGMLFPKISTLNSVARSAEFNRRCRLLGITGVSLHSYRYAWAERAFCVGYPERFAQAALGHNSRAIHHAYARSAKVECPALEKYKTPS